MRRGAASRRSSCASLRRLDRRRVVERQVAIVLLTLLIEPRKELRVHQAARIVLVFCRPRSKVVGVFVLRMARVTFHPFPFHVVPPRGARELLPKRRILERSRLTLPAVLRPAKDPLAHPAH